MLHHQHCCSVNRLGVLLHEGGTLGHLLLNDRHLARECVHDISLLSLGFAEVLRLVHFVLVLVAALPAVGYALLLPAVGYALSVLFIILQIVDVLLAQSLCPCCFHFSPHHWLFDSGFVSVSLQTHLVGVYCFDIRLVHLQRHHSACVTS